MAVTAKMVNKLWNELDNLRIKLEEYKEQKQEVLDNEECKDYPNEDRVDRLTEQVEKLEDALQSLEECCDTLEDYE
jgi:hypothetical protein